MIAKKFDFLNNVGGMNLRSTETSVNTSEESTEHKIIANLSMFRTGGFVVQPGNYQLNSGVTDATEVCAGIDWKNRFYYVKKSNNVWSIPITGGNELLEGTLPSTSQPIDSTVFKGDAIYWVSEGFQPYILDGASLRQLTGNLPTQWETNPPYLCAVKDGTRLVFVSKDAVWMSALLVGNDFLTSGDALFFSNAFGNTSKIVSVDKFGDDLIFGTESQTMFRLTGNTYDEYRLLEISTNASCVNDNNATQIDSSFYFHTGKGIYALTATDFNTQRLGREAELSYPIKPLFSGTEPEMPIPQRVTSKTLGVVGSNTRNNLLCYYYSDRDEDGLINKAMHYDFNEKAWTYRETTPSSFVYFHNADGKYDKIILGTADGKIIHELDGTNSYVNISSENQPVPYLRTGDIGLTDITDIKEFVGISFWFRVLGSATIRLRVYTDFSTIPQNEFTLEIPNTPSSLIYDTSQYNVSLINQTISVYRKFDVPLEARTVSYEIAILGSPVGFKLLSYHIEADLRSLDT